MDEFAHRKTEWWIARETCSMRWAVCTPHGGDHEASDEEVSELLAAVEEETGRISCAGSTRIETASPI
ncbi:MAG: hypothetical protein IPK20_21190 [Betaproteobacteria bacterium]|nr:hypothetical protein [Betaproteobacteria bacterium]